MDYREYPDVGRCRKLTELGFPKTEMAYSSTERGDEILDAGQCEFVKRAASFVGHPKPKFSVCPSVPELKSVIPEKIPIREEPGDFWELEIFQVDGKFVAMYVWRDVDEFIMECRADSLAKALADLAIVLADKGYVVFNNNHP